jgi:hypothetical protein
MAIDEFVAMTNHELSCYISPHPLSLPQSTLFPISNTSVVSLQPCTTAHADIARTTVRSRDTLPHAHFTCLLEMVRSRNQRLSFWSMLALGPVPTNRGLEP